MVTSPSPMGNGFTSSREGVTGCNLRSGFPEGCRAVKGEPVSPGGAPRHTRSRDDCGTDCPGGVSFGDHWYI